MNWLAMLLIFLLILVFGPLLGIWVVNTLFDVSNPYDFQHWFAALISGVIFGGGTTVRRD